MKLGWYTSFFFDHQQHSTTFPEQINSMTFQISGNHGQDQEPHSTLSVCWPDSDRTKNHWTFELTWQTRQQRRAAVQSLQLLRGSTQNSFQTSSARRRQELPRDSWSDQCPVSVHHQHSTTKLPWQLMLYQSHHC